MQAANNYYASHWSEAAILWELREERQVKDSSTARRALQQHVEAGVAEILDKLWELRTQYPGVAFDLPEAEENGDLVYQALDILRERIKDDRLDTRYRTIALTLELPLKEASDPVQFLMIDVDPKQAMRALKDDATPPE